MINKIKYVLALLQLMFQDLFIVAKVVKIKRNSDEVYFANLRTLCHILDKGLNIENFEKGHSKKIYKDALNTLNQIKNSTIKEDKAFLWCESVIRSYENAQKNVNQVENITHKIYTSQEKETIYQFMKSRVSSRNFKNKEISNYIWDEIVEIAIDAPNGCCKQTTRYYIVSDQELIQSLCLNIAGSTGFNNFIPYLVCVTADIRAYGAIDRFTGPIDASLSIENFVLAARANNIFTTILNWQHARKKEDYNVRKIINIPDYEQIILFVAAGYASKIPLKPERVGVKFIRKM